MKQQMYVLPVTCKRCNGVFDLWYDLQNGDFAARRGFAPGKALKQSLCWRCRQTVIEKVRKEAMQDVESEGDEFWLSFE